MLCDHCGSDMDDPIDGLRGTYCSTTCFYAEELDGPSAHGDMPCPVCDSSE